MPGLGLGNRTGKARRGGGSVPATPNRAIWFDSDMELDSDDAFAFALMSGEARESGWRIMGASCSSFVSTGAAALRGLLDYHGATTAPVGANKRTTNPALTGYFNMHTAWAPTVADMLGQVGKTNDDFAEVVTAMRTALVAEPRSDNVLVVVGAQGNLAQLLQSPADGISALTGAQLVEAKFSHIAIMGGFEPGNSSQEYNIRNDVAAAIYVADNSPVPLWYLDATLGGSLKCGPSTALSASTNPYRAVQAVMQSVDPGTLDGSGKRLAFDPATTLVAMRGFGALFDGVAGTQVINANGSNTWTDGAGPHYRITRVATVAAINAEMDRLIALGDTPTSPVLSVGAGRLWTPADIASENRLAWYDAQDAASVTHSAGVVSAWVDKWGLRNLAQATAAKRPTYSADTFGTGIGGLAFLDDLLEGAISGLTTSDTLTVCLFAANDPGGNPADARIASFAGAATADWQSGGSIFQINAAGYLYSYVAGANSSGTSILTSIARPISCVIGPDMQIADGGYTNVKVARTAGSVRNDLKARFAFGSAVHGSTEHFRGKIGEVVLLKNAKQIDIERFAGYAAHRRSLITGVSKYSPYKYAAPRVTT